MKVDYPVANTFIQFSAPRSSSLEEFLQQRSAFSCPASRMVSLEEDPRESTDCAGANDLVIQWPATRGPSLDDEEEATKFAFEMNAAFQNASSQMPVFVAPQVSQAPPPRWASIEDDEDLPDFMKTMQKEEPVKKEEIVKEEEETVDFQCFQWPATRGPSLDEFAEAHGMLADLQPLAAKIMLNLESLAAPPVAPAATNVVPEIPQWTAMDELMKVKSSSMHKESFACDVSTAVSTDEDQALTTPPSGLSDDEDEAQKDTSASLKISLTDTLGLWSVGSAAHEIGTCKPCAFLWKDLKQPGCQNGRDCVFCHLCPPGEVKRRKKTKMFMRKVAKNLQYADEFAMGFEPHFEPQYQNQVAAGYGMW
jgi:hypothetical protein